MPDAPEILETAIIPQPPTGDIKDLILTIRGMQVLLDSDVALLYGYETKYINRAVSRNIDRFPPEFRFQLTRNEVEQILMCQSDSMKSGSTDPSRFHFGTLNSGRGSNIKYLPYAFSEHGIIALAGVLRNKVAAQVSIGITKAFVEMRSFLSANRDVFAKIVSIDNKLLEHDRKFDEVFNLLQQPEAVKQCVFYKGQFYDAFKLVIGFIRQAKTSIAIIDSYANGSVLEMLAEKRPGVSAAIITANPGKIPQQHLQRFAAQHGTLQIRANRDFHDRFVIVDGRDVYAFGASLKDLGKRCFGVFKVEDTDAFLSCVEGILTGTEKYS